MLSVCAKTSAAQEAYIEQNDPHPDPLPSDGRGNSQNPSLAASKALGQADRRRTMRPLPSDGRGLACNAIALSTAAGRNRSSPSPSEARTERGWGEGFPSWANNPPLPGSLLPWWEERERSNPYARGLNSMPVGPG